MKNKDHFRSLFYTFYNNWALITCVKLWPDHIKRINVKAQKISKDFSYGPIHHMWYGSMWSNKGLGPLHWWCSVMPSYVYIDMGQHWLKLCWLVTSIHYLNQCWLPITDLRAILECVTKLQFCTMSFKITYSKLEQLERLRSEDTPRRLMITHTIESYWIPSQENNRSRTENVTEQTWFSKSRWNDLEDIGQGQRSSHATHPLMVVIICGKYGNNRSRTFLKRLQSGHDFQSQGRMTLKI